MQMAVTSPRICSGPLADVTALTLCQGHGLIMLQDDRFQQLDRSHPIKDFAFALEYECFYAGMDLVKSSSKADINNGYIY
ncbi:hypothetical protein SLE2022_273580 [Rubroshorea leprosula]